MKINQPYRYTIHVNIRGEARCLCCKQKVPESLVRKILIRKFGKNARSVYEALEIYRNELRKRV